MCVCVHVSIMGQDLAPVAWWLKSLISVTFFFVCVWVWVYVNNRCDSIMCIDCRGTHVPSVFNLCPLVLVFLSEQCRSPWSSCRETGVGVECVFVMYKLWDGTADLQMCWMSLCWSSSHLVFFSSSQTCPIHTHVRMDLSLVPLWLYAVILTRWVLFKPQPNNLLPGS